MASVNLKVGCNQTSTDLDALLKVQHTRNVVGSFYEALAAHVFGAQRWSGGEVYADESHRGQYSADNIPNCLIPDLVRRKDATYIEVKGGNRHSQFKVYRWQAELYNSLRRNAQVPVYRPRVEYAIFMHDLQGMTKKYRTARNLIAALTQNTLCCVLLDLDVVLAFERWVGTVEYGDWNSGRQYYPHFYPISSRHVRQLMEHPRQCLTEMGLNTARYSVVEHQAAENLVIDETKAEAFPVLEIQTRRHLRSGYHGPVDESWLTKVRQAEIFSTEPDILGGLADDECPYF